MTAARQLTWFADHAAEGRPAPPTRALMVREPYAERIVSGIKTWEMRGRATRIRGLIGIIAGGTGTIVGVATLVDCLGPLDRREYYGGWRQRGADAPADNPLPYATTYAWVLADARRATPVVPYHHPSGAVVWVSLSPDAARAVAAAVGDPAGV